MFKDKDKHKHIHTQNKKKKSKKIKMIIITTIILIAIISTIFIKFNNNTAKISKIGNNSSSQEIVEHILNISSYQTEIEVEIKSNKNTNKYKLKQTYISNESNTQEVIEPSNIQGVKIIKEKNNLKIENTKLSLTKVIENYKDITQNNLDLINFIENYKNNTNSKFKEENNQIIMETTAATESNYQKYEILYVSKENGNPIKMEIKDTNQNTIIYIIYNEIKINKIANEKIYAFKLFDTSKEI
ncbi:MAG: hypothetical protein IJE05_06070 [Clostridia bacterium]|nr:hypothetical protein [Clostridia bacterium]